MQQITIICIGKIKNQSLKKEIDELSKRIQRLEIIELKEIKDKNPETLKQKEEELILHHIKQTHSTFLLHEHGNKYSTKEFSSLISSVENPITLLITGPYGPSQNLIPKFSRISLSPMTFTHEQTLYLLLEQLYRAQCIEKNIPYTK